MSNAIVDRLFAVPTYRECEKLVGELDHFFLETFKQHVSEDSKKTSVKEKFTAPQKLELDIKKINPLDILTPFLEALKPFIVRNLSQSPNPKNLRALKHKVKEIFPSINEKTLLQSIELLKTPAIYIALSLRIMFHDRDNLKESVEALVGLLRNPEGVNPELVIARFTDLYGQCKNTEEKMLVKDFFKDFVNRCLGEYKVNYRDHINNFIISNARKNLILASTQVSYKNKYKFEKRTADYINKLSGIKTIKEWFLWFEKEDELINQFLSGTSAREKTFKKFIVAQRKELLLWLSSNVTVGQSYLLHPDEGVDSYMTHALNYCARGVVNYLSVQKNIHEKNHKKWSFRFKRFFNRTIMGRLIDPVQRELDFTNSIIQAAKTLEADPDLDKLLQLFENILPALKNRKRREFYKGKTLTTLYLEKAVGKLISIFPQHPKIQKLQDDLFNDDLCFSMEHYLHLRKGKPFVNGKSFYPTAARDFLFDAIWRGGKKTKEAKGKTHDGLSHREIAVDKLINKIKNCYNIEDYLSYCAHCLRELDTIYDKNSRLKKIILQHIKKIIVEKIIPLGDMVQKVKLFEMLYCKKTKHPLHKTNIQLLASCLKQEGGVDLSLLKEGLSSLKEEHPLINHYLKKSEIVEVDTHLLKTPAAIDKHPALKEFHNLVLSRLTNELLAFKVAATGKFTLMPEALTSAGYFAPLSLAKLAEHVAVPAASLASGSFVAVAQGIRFADQYRQRGQYQDISKILTSSSQCDEIAKIVASNLTKIWEYQIKKLYEGDRDNVKVFADCAVTRMVDYLVSKEYLRYGHLPLDLQFCFAVRSHRLRHGVSGNRLITADCTSLFSDKAWIVEEIFEKTPVQLKGGALCRSTASLDKYGAAKDGEEIANLLCWSPTQEKINNKDYRKHKYSLRSFPRFTFAALTEAEELAQAKREIAQLKEENAQLMSKNKNHEKRLKKLESLVMGADHSTAANQPHTPLNNQQRKGFLC